MDMRTRRRRRPIEVFVSYSRQDAALVTPIVALIRTTRRLVFQDLDSLRAGDRWRPQIDGAVRAARLVVVFWCDHARSSPFVAEEYRKAISWDKDVVPVLLDGTPLPDDLGQFHALDFCQLAARLHPQVIAPQPAQEPARPVQTSRHRLVALVVGSLGAVVLGASILLGVLPRSSPVGHGSAPVVQPSPAPPDPTAGASRPAQMPQVQVTPQPDRNLATPDSEPPPAPPVIAPPAPPVIPQPTPEPPSWLNTPYGGVWILAGFVLVSGLYALLRHLWERARERAILGQLTSAEALTATAIAEKLGHELLSRAEAPPADRS